MNYYFNHVLTDAEVLILALALELFRNEVAEGIWEGIDVAEVDEVLAIVTGDILKIAEREGRP